MKMYSSLSHWWPLLSSPADYAEEAAAFLALMDIAPGTRPTLLELGSGGGNLASHLTAHLRATLSDIAPGMLAVSRQLNPDVPHVEGDMRTLRLGQTFDIVLIHDAVAYCTTSRDLRAALETAAVHCRPGGRVIVAPDAVRESFEPQTECGGEDAPDGRGLRYLEWSWDPDPSDTTTEVAYTLVMRDADGSVRVELDRHIEGLFPEAEWLRLFGEVGLVAHVVHDAWGRHVFVARWESLRGA